MASNVELGTITGAPAINTTTKNSGSASMRVTASGQYFSYPISISANQQLWARYYIYVASYPDAQTMIFTLADAGGDGTQVVMNTDGTLELWYLEAGVLTAQIGSDSSALSLNTWYRIETYLESRGTTWAIAGRIDGAQFASSTSVTTPGSATDVTFAFGISGGNADIYYDDIAVNDATGNSQNSWPGVGKIVVLVPTGAGDSNCTTGNASMVNEIPPSNTATSGSTMCELDTTTTTAYFNVTDSSTAGIGSSDYVALVYELTRMREETSGATNYFMRMKSASGGTTTTTTVVDTGDTTVRTNPSSTTSFGTTLIAYTDPTTGVAWTPTGTNSLDNMQVGVGTTDGNPDTWALGVYVMVEYGGSAPTDTSPVGQWRLDEGSNQAISDASINLFNGTMGDGTCLAGNTSCPSWTSGRYGGALSFDGDSYVNFGDVDALDLMKVFTVSLWVKSATNGAAATESHFIDKSTCSGGADAGSFEIQAGGFVASKPSFLVIPSGGVPSAYVSATGTTSIDDTNWHLLTGVYDGTKLYMYVDGKLETSTNLSNVSTASTSWNFEIGGNCNGHGGIFWNGLIDDVRIYKRALSAAEIMGMYDSNGNAMHFGADL